MKTILIVDDDQDVVESSSEVMSYEGFKVVGTALNGLEAVEKFKECNPDVMLLDLMMPEYDGWYTLDELKKSHPDAKIIIITGDQTADTTKKLKNYNIFAVFIKPVIWEDLFETIKQ